MPNSPPQRRCYVPSRICTTFTATALLVKILPFMWSTNFIQMYERLIHSSQQLNICPLQRQVCWCYCGNDFRLNLIIIRIQPTYPVSNMQCFNVPSVTMKSHNWYCALNGQYSVYQPSVRELCLRDARFERILINSISPSVFPKYGFIVTIK